MPCLSWKWKLLLLGLVANLANISPGMSLGYSGVVLKTLQDENNTNPRPITNEEASWVASLASIATPIGCLISGPLLDRFGRRIALLSLNIPMVIGWFLITFAGGDSFIKLMYAGRVFTGLGVGMGSAPATVYTAEISTDSLRGMLVTWTSIAISFGIFLVYLLGTALQDQWQIVAGISAAFPLIAIILTFIFLPESPAWLLSKGRREDAEKSFRRIRGVRKTEETSAMLENEFEMIAKRAPNSNSQQQPDKLWKEFTKPSCYKPFIIMNIFFFFQQFSGIFVVIFYAVSIVQEIDEDIDPYLITVLIGLTRVIVTIIMSFISNRFGRRIPAIVSGVGMTICMTCLSTCLYLKSNGTITPDLGLGWLPVTALILYILTSTVGFLTLPWAMIGEVYPARIRGVAAGMTTCFAYICSFITSKIYTDMVEAMELYGVYYFYSGMSLLGAIFVIFFLPETKGKSLLEIEEYFNNKSKKMQNIDQELISNHKQVIIVPRKDSIQS